MRFVMGLLNETVKSDLKGDKLPRNVFQVDRYCRKLTIIAKEWPYSITVVSKHSEKYLYIYLHVIMSIYNLSVSFFNKKPEHTVFIKIMN